jgi:hypothetical protein
MRITPDLSANINPKVLKDYGDITLLIEDSSSEILEAKVDLTPRMEFWYPICKDTLGYRVENTHYVCTYKFHRVEGKMHLYYAHINKGWDVISKKSKEVVHTQQVDQEAILFRHIPYESMPQDMVNNPVNYEYIDPYDVYDMTGAYNEYIWSSVEGSFNTKVSSKAKKDLAKHAPLEEQFKAEATEVVEERPDGYFTTGRSSSNVEESRKESGIEQKQGEGRGRNFRR